MNPCEVERVIVDIGAVPSPNLGKLKAPNSESLLRWMALLSTLLHKELSNKHLHLNS